MRSLERWFLVGLVTNGIGSAVLFVLIPYWILKGNSDESLMFVSTAVMTSCGVLGAWYWGRHLDRQISSWRTRLITLGCELLVSSTFCISILFGYTSIYWLLFLIGLLEFFFAYELIWSRMTWHELTLSSDTKSSARRFSVAASLISVVGPAIGVLGGLHDLLWQAALANLLSAIPYAWLCIRVMQTKSQSFNKIPAKEKIQTSYANFARFLVQNPRWIDLTIGFIAISACAAAVTVCLPFVLVSSAADPRWISVFYVVTSLLTSLSGLEKVTCSFDRIGLHSWRLVIAACVVAGVFLAIPTHLWVQTLWYLLFNIMWMKISIEFLGYLYHTELDLVRGRFMGLLRISTQCIPPIVSLILAFVAKGQIGFVAAIVAICSGLFGSIFILRFHSHREQSCNVTREGEL